MYNDYYAPKAYDSTRIHHRSTVDESQFGFVSKSLRLTKLPSFPFPQCKEFLSRNRETRVLELLKSNKDSVKKMLREPGHEIQYWETFRNPKVILIVITKLLLIFSICSWCISIFLSIIISIQKPSWLFSSRSITLLSYSIVPTILYFLGRYILKQKRIKDCGDIQFNRRKGTITIPRKKSPALELPFEEFDGFLGSTVNPSGSTDYHLILAHRYSPSLVQHPAGRETPWEINIEWELVQQFMDISKPLPDIPSVEPFRDKDPITAELDKKHGRPSLYWRDIDIEKAEQMHEASYKAASEYPWGLTREQAIASGWRPSGFGEGDWLKG